MQPHSSKDNNVKPDSIRFNQGSCVLPIWGLVVFCKPTRSVHFIKCTDVDLIPG